MSSCGVPLYDGEGSPTCGRTAGHEARFPYHTWTADDGQGGTATETWMHTACWKFHNAGERMEGWNCTQPVGHDVTES